MEQAMEDLTAPIASTRAQQWLLSLHRRFGTGGVVGLVTLVSVLLSVGVTALTLIGAHGFGDATVVVPSFAVAVAVPVIVAPLASFLVVELVSQLDRANAHLDRIANTDALTGVFNRRGFFATAASEFGPRDAGVGASVVVGMVDLDRFKELNDRYGHHRGDAALRAMAAQADAVLGGDGVLGRFGGDEFAFVLRRPESLSLEALRARLEAACGRLELDGVVVTASIGLCEVLADDSMDTALSRADADLYRAKVASRSDHPRHAAPSWSGDSPIRTRH